MEKRNGVTKEMLQNLRNKKDIMANIMWKPDAFRGGYRTFFPYLSIGFVKQKLIDCLGPENLSFVLQKDQESYAMGHLEVLFENGNKETYSAIGVEKEGRGISDQEKKNKVKFKGNVADTIKSCAEWLGLSVPEGINSQQLKEENGIIFTKEGKQIGNLNNSMEQINAYLNGISHTRYLLAKVHSINKDKFKSNPELTEQLKNLLNELENEK